ncbi:hypothetical protein Tco_0889339 [Tanacetum coccineum]
MKALVDAMDGIKEATPDPLLKNLPVIVLSAEDSESDDECPIRFSRNRNTKLQSSSKILTGSLIDEDTDEDIVDSQVAGDEVVPHSNDSIDNEADDEYDYSDSFIDDGPIVDEPTSEDLSDSD